MVWSIFRWLLATALLLTGTHAATKGDLVMSALAFAQFTLLITLKSPK